jgi:Na+(H+)/acetate symporter ActP
MASVDYTRWLGLMFCVALAAHAGWALLDDKYCSSILSKIYTSSDEATEKAQLRNARIAALAVGVASIYYGFKLFVMGHH